MTEKGIKATMDETKSSEEELKRLPKKAASHHDTLGFYKYYKAQQMFKLHDFELMYQV